MKRTDLSYLENRQPNPYSETDRLGIFIYADTGEEFGCGTIQELAQLKLAGIVDPTAEFRLIA